MDLKIFLTAASGLLFVLALIILTVIGIRWLRHQDRFKNFFTSSRRLTVCEQVSLDSKRRLVIVKYDQKESVILLGLTHEIVLSTHENQGDPL